MLGASPGTASASSVKRRGPSRRAWTRSSVHRSPTLATARSRGSASSTTPSCPARPPVLWFSRHRMGRWMAKERERAPARPTGTVTCEMQVASRGGTDMGVAEELEQLVRDVAGRVGPSVVAVGRGARGSGVVVGEGRVLTNAHNLRDRTTTVTFADGRSEQGTVAGVDVDGDLAVLTVDTAGAPVADWADEPVAAGALVLAASRGRRGLRVTF